MIYLRLMVMCSVVLAACPSSSESNDAGSGSDASPMDMRSAEDALSDMGFDSNSPDTNMLDANEPGPDQSIAADAGDDAGPDMLRNLCGDCAASCEAVPVGGNLYCVAPYEPFRELCGAEPAGACCNDSMCPDDGVCTAFSHQYCGGVAPPLQNLCRTPECVDDAGCSDNEACIPAGAFGQVVSKCLAAECRADSDCTTSAGGQCSALNSGDCGRVGGFYCTYDDDPCRQDSDCPPMMFPQRCVSAAGSIMCVADPPRP